MTTTKLKLPELTASQSQKHVTHNEALFFLDNLVQLSVIDKDLATPPGSPTLGDTYLVGAAPTGSWAGKTNQIASYDGSGWIFFAPAEGWKAWVQDEDTEVTYTGSVWVSVSQSLDKFLVYRNADQALSAGTWTNIQYDTAIHNDQGCFDLVNYQLEPSRSGYYFISASYRYKQDTVAPVWLGIRLTVNGAAVDQSERRMFNAQDEEQTLETSIVLKLVISDVVRAQAYGHTNASIIDGATNSFSGFEIK